jgi:hypothetical protein
MELIYFCAGIRDQAARVCHGAPVQKRQRWTAPLVACTRGVRFGHGA